jgi:hypothetical protein
MSMKRIENTYINDMGKKQTKKEKEGRKVEMGLWHDLNTSRVRA